MSVDTAAKRASIQAFPFGQLRAFPTGSITTSDRAILTWLYSGFSYNPAVVFGAAGRTSFSMRMGFRM